MTGLSGCTPTEQELRYNAGRVISAEMLQELINAYRSEYRIALISTTGTALLLSSPGETPQADFISGHESFVWAQAAEQLAASGQMSLQIARRHLDSDNCPALAQTLNAFFEKAEPLLASQFTRFPSREEIWAAAMTGNQEVMVDAPVYRLHVVAADSMLAYTIASRSDSELLQAIVALSSSIGDCAARLEPAVERIYGLY